MTRKRFSLIVLSLLLAGLLSCAALVLIVDPFEIYHRALFYSPPYESGKQMYSVAGIARAYDYDSIIIGSSVTENCTPSVYDRALGGRFVKLCMNGGLSRDHAKVMDIALRTHQVRRVVNEAQPWADKVWEALNPENKVSLFVRFLDLHTREVQDVICNKHH